MTLTEDDFESQSPDVVVFRPDFQQVPSYKGTWGQEWNLEVLSCGPCKPFQICLCPRCGLSQKNSCSIEWLVVRDCKNGMMSMGISVSSNEELINVNDCYRLFRLVASIQISVPCQRDFSCDRNEIEEGEQTMFFSIYIARLVTNASLS